MTLISQRIPNLLGGVTQRPATQSLPSQAVVQENAISHVTRGVVKRPPTTFIGKLTPDVVGTDTAFTHVIDRDENERYHVIVANGDIKVFDAVTGDAIPVLAPLGKAYLNDPTNSGFRAVTVGDTTIITNRGVDTKTGTTQSPSVRHEALLFVKQADFSTTYQVTLNGTVVAIRTTDQDSPASRQGISTDRIAADLLLALQGTGALSPFTFELIGSTIFLRRIDGEDFELSSADGLSDNGLAAIKDEVQTFEDLPSRAINGFVVRISGAADTNKDDWYVKYDDLGTPGKVGVWRECPRPGTLVDFDSSTMPHRLALGGNVSGFDPLPHQAAPVSAGVVKSESSTDVPGVWETFFSPIASTPNRTRTHLGGAELTSTENAALFTASFSITGLSLMEEGASLYVRLYKNGVKVGERKFTNDFSSSDPFAGPNLGDNSIIQSTLQAEGLVIGDVMKLSLEYEFAVTPPEGQRATLVSNEPRYTLDVGKKVWVGTETVSGNTSQFFPIGTTITITVDAVPFSVVVNDVPGQDLATVSEALSNLIDAHLDYTSTFTPVNTMVIRRADGAPLEVSISRSFATLTFLNTSLNLVPDFHIGDIVKNITDGSSGVVTTNTATSLTVSSLTGGSDNLVQAGDIFTIAADPSLGLHFVFSPIPWRPRGAGDIDVVTFPSFMDRPISEVFFYQNRLGFLSQENIVFSSSGDLFNLFRFTATDLRPDDSIDVRSAHADVTIFDSAFLWAGGLFVKSDNVWFNVSGNPALTPTTIRLDPVGRYPSSKDPRPVVVGGRAFFTRAKFGNSQVFELSLTNDGTTTEALDITKDLPTYIRGNPLAMVGDQAEGFLALLTDTGSGNILYIYAFLVQGDRRLLSSWGQWTFSEDTRVLNMSLADGVLGLVTKHDDGLFIEQLDLSLEPDANEKVAYLDRRVAAESGSLLGVPVTYDAVTDTTTWTLPYEVVT